MRTVRTHPLPAVAPTRAPIALGAIVAGLQVMEIGRLLAGDVEGSIIGHEYYLDLACRVAMTTRLVRNRRCRFDHVAGPSPAIPDLCLDELVARFSGARAVAVQGQRFVGPLGCARCGTAVMPPRFVRDFAQHQRPCPACGETVMLTGMDVSDALVIDKRDCEQGRTLLSSLGVGEGDVIKVETGKGLRLLERREETPSPGDPPPRTVVIVGLGNIGSNLVDLLVRTQAPGSDAGSSASCPGAIDRLVLIDPDSYEFANLAGQRIDAADVGQPKALVQARHARHLRPFLSVVAYVSRIEDVPAGVLSGAIVVGCLDSRPARQSLAEMAWRVGAPYVDAAVDAGVPAVRLAGYLPGPKRGCLECSYMSEDYAASWRIGCLG